jgi:hypothetical protein
MQLNNLSNEQLVLIAAIVVWDIAWKGFALWKAARNKRKGWFIVLLLVNSIGVLPIIYLLLEKPAVASKS